MTEPVTIYRLKLRRGRGGSSSPDWRLYEDEKDFNDALLEALIEAQASNPDNYRQSAYRPCMYWVRHILRREDDCRPVARVISAEKLEDGRWVDVNPRLLPPRLEFESE